MSRWVAALGLLALVALAGCGGDADRAGRARGDVLVIYSREGGIKFQASRLAVSRDGSARLRSRGCVTVFRVGARRRRRLRLAVARTDLTLLGEDHRAPSGAPDAVAETITIGSDKVHIEDATSLPPPARRELAPLLTAIGEVLVEGERRAGARCG